MSQKSSTVNIKNKMHVSSDAYVVYNAGCTMVIAVCTSKEQAIKIVEAEPEGSRECIYIKKAPFNKRHEITDIIDDVVF